MRSIILLFLFAGARGQVFALEDIDKAYAALLAPGPKDAQDRCRGHRSAIITDKPVYRLKEVIYASVYNYYVQNKKPSDCPVPENQSLHLYTFGNAHVADFEVGEAFRGGTMGQDFKLEINKAPHGGPYKIRQKVAGDEIQIFILNFAAKPFAIVIEWNSETVAPQFTLKGCLELRVFAQRSVTFNEVSYRFIGDQNAIDKFSGKLSEKGKLDIEYTITRSFTELVIFEAHTLVSGQLVAYKKEFYEAVYNRMVLETMTESGKLFVGTNRVYFRLFASKERKMEAVIVAAELFRGEKKIEGLMVRSELEGKGCFDLPLTADDLAEATAAVPYTMKVMLDKGISRKFRLFTPREFGTSPLGMAVSKKVLAPTDPLVVTLTGNAAGLLVFQDKTQVLFKQTVTVAGSLDVPVNFRELLPVIYGGVFTLQFYVPLPADQADALPGAVKYGGTAIQEVDVFLEPESFINVEIEPHGDYSIGQGVQYTMSVKQCDTRCADLMEEGIEAYGHLEVVDESAFVEIEASRVAPTVFTKVFLENEVFNANREFFNSVMYVDPMFFIPARKAELTEHLRKLDLLLGVQRIRKFALDPNRVQAFIAAPGDAKHADYYFYFLHLLPLGESVLAASFADRAKGPELTKVGSALNAPPPEKGGEGEDKGQFRPPEAVSPNKPFIIPAEVQHDNIYHKGYFEWRNMRTEETIVYPNRSTFFRIRVLSMSNRGHYGYTDFRVRVDKDFDIIGLLPANLYVDETFTLVFTVSYNKEKGDIKTVKFDDGETVQLGPKQSYIKKLTITKDNVPMKFAVKDGGDSPLGEKSIVPVIMQEGYYTQASGNGVVGPDSPLNSVVALPGSAVPGTVQMDSCFRNSSPSFVLGFLKNINHFSYICFEQRATFVFPAAMALNFLNTQKTLDEETKKVYNRLKTQMTEHAKAQLGFECADGGFRWFDYDAAHGGHVTLTAYGLWQFRMVDALKIVPPLYDANMLKRKVDFIKQRSKPEGGYTYRGDGHPIGVSPVPVSDVYISYVVSQEKGVLEQQFPEQIAFLDKLYNGWAPNKGSVDNYRLALLGLIYKNRGDTAKANEIITYLMTQQGPDGSITSTMGTVTNSGGVDRAIETTSLAMYLVFEAEKYDLQSNIEAAFKFITANLKGGAYGSTQAVILSMLVYIQYFKAVESGKLKQNFDITVKDGGSQPMQVVGGDPSVKCKNMNTEVKKVEKVGVALNTDVTTKENAISKATFSVDYKYYDRKPPPKPGQLLTAKMVDLRNDGLVQAVEVFVKSASKEDEGMWVIELHKPSCYDYNINDLQRMVAAETIAAYDISHDNSFITLYFYSIQAGKSINFKMSFIKTFLEANCLDRTHLAYLYYTREASVAYLYL